MAAASLVFTFSSLLCGVTAMHLYSQIAFISIFFYASCNAALDFYPNQPAVLKYYAISIWTARVLAMPLLAAASLIMCVIPKRSTQAHIIAFASIVFVVITAVERWSDVEVLPEEVRDVIQPERVAEISLATMLLVTLICKDAYGIVGTLMYIASEKFLHEVGDAYGVRNADLKQYTLATANLLLYAGMNNGWVL